MNFSRAEGSLPARRRSRIGLVAALVASLFAASCSDEAADQSAAATGDGTGQTGGGNGGGGGTGGSAPEPLKPASAGVRRLLGRQYRGSIEVLLGSVGAAAADPPEDTQVSGLEAIGASQLALPPSTVEKYEQSARAVASASVADAATLASILPCTPTDLDDRACFADFAKSFGRLAWRRALTDTEVAELVTAGVIGARANESVPAGIESIVSAILQSPYFLYIVELGEPDAAQPEIRRLTPNELATRISMFVVARTPDEALLDLAESGGLASEAQIRGVVTELLKRPEAKTALAAFYDEVYKLREVSRVSKDPELFPQFTQELKTAMREETLRFLDDIVWNRNADAREILRSPTTFVNADLAELYGIDAPAEGFAEVTLPPEQNRTGILGKASFLARFAHPGMTSATRRGLFVESVLLCNNVPPPPPDVNPVLPGDDGTPKTAKQKLEQHQKNPTCAACHSLMDPLGFALETFDAIGQYRTKDHGLSIDTSGSVPIVGEFQNASELADLLWDNPRATQCMVRQLYRQSIGQVEDHGQMSALEAIDTLFEEHGYSIQGVLVDLCASEAFRLVGEPR